MSQNAYVGRLKDGRGDIFYPATKTSVVYDENGVNIEEKVRYFLHPDGAIAYVEAAQIDAHTIDGHDLDWILAQCAVEFDDVPTEGSQKAARSGGIWSAIQSAISRIPTALSELTEDANHRTVKDSEKETWNGKQDKITATGLLKGNGSGTISAATAYTDYLKGSHCMTTPSSSNKVATAADIAGMSSEQRYCQATFNSTTCTYINKGFTVNPNVARTITIPQGVTRVKLTLAGDFSGYEQTGLTAMLNGTEVIRTNYWAQYSYQSGAMSNVKILDVSPGDVISTGVPTDDRVTGRIIVEALKV